MDIAAEGFSIREFSVPTDQIPKQRADGKVYRRDGTQRTTIVYGNIKSRGQYGIIQQSLRADRAVVIKRPCKSSVSLQPEACLQELCRMHLERNLICSAIPEVYDIFVFADEVRFSMEWIDGLSLIEFLRGLGAEFETTFLNIIIQICFILEILGRELKFDHRDLKPENIWIRRKAVPKNYVISIDGITYTLEFEYQAILLDFGFACIGSTIPPMSLGQEVIPAIDPCPKTGRDMYHILNRLLSDTGFCQKISPPVLKTMTEWMRPYNVRNPHLTYLITADTKFENTSLKPAAIIRWFFGPYASCDALL
jgi:serine/threonine protein kinase